VDKRERLVVSKWNGVIRKLIIASKTWDELMRLVVDEGVGVEGLPVKAQDYLSIFEGMQFTDALTDIAYMSQAELTGLGDFLVELEKEETQEESKE